jgi:hypothetical protein
MSWQAAVVGLGAIQYKQQGAIGKFNQAVANRNAEAAENQIEGIESKLEFDIAQFDKEFKKIEGKQKVSQAKAGTEFSGSALRIQRINAEEAALQRNILKYNAQVQKTQAIERASAFRIQGQMARQQAKMAQIQTVTQTVSLLGSPKTKPSTQGLNFEYTGGVTGGSFGE